MISYFLTALWVLTAIQELAKTDKAHGGVHAVCAVLLLIAAGASFWRGKITGR